MTIRTRKIGKLGGGAEPLDFTPDVVTREVVVELPDGEWAIDVAIDPVGQGNESLTVAGEVVLVASISTTQHYGIHGVARHQHGTVPISCGSRWRLGTITAYPEPT